MLDGDTVEDVVGVVVMGVVVEEEAVDTNVDVDVGVVVDETEEVGTGSLLATVALLSRSDKFFFEVFDARTGGLTAVESRLLTAIGPWFALVLSDTLAIDFGTDRRWLDFI